MRLAITDRFRQVYQELTAEEQALADKALRLLADNLRHPSLQVKKIKGTEGIWEARASRSIRLTFQVHGDLLVLRTIGQRDEALGRP